jgi:hypothetical protein
VEKTNFLTSKTQMQLITSRSMTGLHINYILHISTNQKHCFFRVKTRASAASASVNVVTKRPTATKWPSPKKWPIF